MKQKKQEHTLLKELQRIKEACVDASQLKHIERRMNNLIQRALLFYKDEVNPSMSQFYFQYGSVLLQLMEEKDDICFTQEPPIEKHNKQNIPITMIHHDKYVQKEEDQYFNIFQQIRELKDAQVALENLEASRQIIQTQINKLQAQYDELQQRMIIFQKLENRSRIIKYNYLKVLKEQLTFTLERREDFNEALETYEKVIMILDQFKATQVKEISEIQYKIGSVLLLQGAPGCEARAFQNLQTSLRLCLEAQNELKLTYGQLNTSHELANLKEQLLRLESNDQVMLLILLSEKLEDTLSQLRESQECRLEIEKWQKGKFTLGEQQLQENSQNQKMLIHFKFSDVGQSGSFQPQLKAASVFLGVFGSASKNRMGLQK